MIKLLFTILLLFDFNWKPPGNEMILLGDTAIDLTINTRYRIDYDPSEEGPIINIYFPEGASLTIIAHRMAEVDFGNPSHIRTVKTQDYTLSYGCEDSREWWKMFIHPTLRLHFSMVQRGENVVSPISSLRITREGKEIVSYSCLDFRRNLPTSPSGRRRPMPCTRGWAQSYHMENVSEEGISIVQ